MSDTFGQLLNPLDEAKLHVLRIVVQLAASENIPIMLFGAFARELHFYHAYDIEGGRATEDIDTSIQVLDWKSYNRFASVLTSNDFKQRYDDHPEKLVHMETGLELDLLPFGEIAGDSKQIIWPTDGSPWSVVGFDDAFSAARYLNLNPERESPLELAVAPVPAIVVLKITAIHDRPEKRFKKDGTDISFIVSNYLDIGNRLRLQEGEDTDIMEFVSEDLDRASAMLLGRDISRMTSRETRDHVVELIRHEVESNSRCHIARGMVGSAFPGFPRAREVVRAILDGVIQMGANREP